MIRGCDINTRLHKPANNVPARAAWLPEFKVANKLSTYFKIATCLLFLGIYAGVDVPLKYGQIPMVSALPGFLLMLRLPGIISNRSVKFVIGPAVVIIAFAIVSPSLGLMYGNRLAAVAQTAYSMGLAFVAIYALNRIGTERLHRVLSYILPIYLAFIAIEVVLPPFQHFLEAYNTVIFHSNIDLDTLADRETSMGGYRPKFFTSEASFVAISVMLLVTAYLWTGHGLKRYFRSFGFALAGLVIVRSPIVVLTFPIIFTTLMTDPRLSRYRASLALGLALFTMIGAAFTLTFGQAIIERRIEGATNGDDFSVTFRTYGAFQVAYEVVRKYPLFGAGPGGFDLVKNEIVNTELRLGVPLEAVERDWRISVANAPSYLLASFGLVGFVFGLFLLVHFVNREIGKLRAAVYVAIASWCFSYAAVYTPKFLVTLILIVAVAKMSESFHAVRAAPARAGTKQARPVMGHRVPHRAATRNWH